MVFRILGSRSALLIALGFLNLTIACSNQPKSLAFSPSGKILAISGNNRLVLWSIAEGRPLVKSGFPALLAGSHKGPLSFSSDARVLAVGSTRGVEIWDLQTLETQFEIPYAVEALTFCPDSNRLVQAAGSGYGATDIWSVPERKLVASENSGTWNMSGKKEVLNFGSITKPFANPLSIACSADGKWLAVANEADTIELVRPDMLLGAIPPGSDGRLWLDARGRGELIHSMAFLPDRRTLLTCTPAGPGHGLTFWDVETQQLQKTLDFSCSAIAASSGTSLVAALSGQFGEKPSVVIWRSDSGEAVQSVNGKGVQSIALSPDGRMLAVGYEGGPVRLIDVSTGKSIKQINF